MSKPITPAAAKPRPKSKKPRRLAAVPGSGPSQRTIRRRLRELRRLIEDPATDGLTARVAYTVEIAIRWATEPTTGWLPPTEEVSEAVTLIRAGL